MPDCRARHTFRNWSHTLEFRPNQFCKPRTAERIAEIVREARARRGCVRTQGAGHSFSQLLPTDDTLLSLDDMDQSTISKRDHEVTASAGFRLKDLIPHLATLGLGLKNMGSVTEQSIAGAVSTGTHGTGLGFGCMSTQVSRIEMVTGTGEVVRFAAGDAEMRGARLSLGALGIITEMTLECVDHYQIEYSAYVGRFDEVMANLHDLKTNNERMLLWWLVPLFGRDEVLIITKNPPGDPRGVLADAEDRARSRPFDLRHTPLGKGADALWRFVSQQSGSAGPRFKRIWHMRGDYDEMLTLPLLPVFHTECEYAVPHQQAVPALDAFRRVVEENDFDLKLPVEVRFMDGDDLFLSPGNAGPVCYIGASTEHNTAEVFSRFEPLMRQFGGRPHWGKHFTLTRHEIEAMYPGGYDDFVALRNRLDPDRVFSNSLLTEIFG